MKKEIIAISLLLVLIAPVATICAYLQIEKAAIRREIKWKMIAGIDEEELVLLKFTTDEAATKLQWEHSKEFEYKGQMYDVVSKKVKGDTIYFRCWWDHEETKLNKKLKKLATVAFDRNEEKQNTQRVFYNFLFSFYYKDVFEWQAKPSHIDWAIFKDSMHAVVFNSLFLPPPTPPPQFI